MRAYSQDLRERLVQAVAEGQPMSTVARRFLVSTITVKRLVQLQQQTGSVAPYCRRRAAHRIRPGNRITNTLGSRAGCDRPRTVRLVGRTPRGVTQRSDDAACASAIRVDPYKKHSKQAKGMKTSASSGKPKLPGPTHTAWCLWTKAAPTRR